MVTQQEKKYAKENLGTQRSCVICLRIMGPGSLSLSGVILTACTVPDVRSWRRFDMVVARVVGVVFAKTCHKTIQWAAQLPSHTVLSALYYGVDRAPGEEGCGWSLVPRSCQ